MLNVIMATGLLGNTLRLVQKAQSELPTISLGSGRNLCSCCFRKNFKAGFLRFSFQPSYPNYVIISHMKELLKTQYILQLKSDHISHILYLEEYNKYCNENNT